MRKNFAQILAIITVVLVLASIVLTFIGAFMKGDLGRGFLFTGMFGFVAVSVLGWIMITVYNRVHKDEALVNEMMDEMAENKEKEGETK